MRTRNTIKEELVKEKAVELLVKSGLEGFTVNKLAKECGISVATLYIYYKDKDDLILKIAQEKAGYMNEAILKDFDPELSLADGLRQQWKNRAAYMLSNPRESCFFEQLRSSTYQEKIYEAYGGQFQAAMGKFMENSIKRGEIAPMPKEVYWSIAFAPLYNLIRFHNEGRTLGGKPFVLTEELIWKTFDLVLKALKK